MPVECRLLTAPIAWTTENTENTEHGEDRVELENSRCASVQSERHLESTVGTGYTRDMTPPANPSDELAGRSSPETEANRRLWDTWAGLHVNAPFYGVDTLRAGGLTLTELDLEEVGPVAGKSLLHLQCHFGLDTLSWARLGARVTGIDLSPVAIDQARRLSEELGLDARFVCADLETVDAELPERFDVIYTSFGVLAWLRDLRPWAELIARRLAPGGSFHLIEFHPMLEMFDDAGKEIVHPYFHRREPLVGEATSTYAGVEHEAMVNYQWTHSLGDVVNCLLSAGLTLMHLREFPYCLHGCYDFLVEREPGRFVLREHPMGVPLLFSIKARLRER
jgi:SAM-dependent methyltransferase